MSSTFFAPRSAFRDTTYVVLPKSEAQHAVCVLRKQNGDEVVVVDGEGGWYRVSLDSVSHDHASGHILETRQQVSEPSYHLHVGLALLKNRNRFETFLEKAVELGASRITPLRTHRTEIRGFKEHRARQIMIAAMKQCGRSRLPLLSDPQPFGEVLRTQQWDSMLIAHELAPHTESLMAALRPLDKNARIYILVGPEGGFTADEIQKAEENGFAPVSLGPRRLRAETAAIAAMSTIMTTLG